MLHTDEQLMLSVKDGNRDAFRILTDRHYTNTLNFIYRFVKNRTVAEDLCTAYGFLDHSLKEDCATIQSH